MKAFAALYSALDATTKTNEKVAAIAAYLERAAPADAAWAIHFLSGNRPKRLIGARKLATWALEEAGLPAWLFEESYHAVGDLAETIALVLPPAASARDLPLHVWIEERLLPLAGADDEVQRREITRAWQELDGIARFVWNKLITGGFRVGVSRSLVIRAVARMSGIDEPSVAHRLTGSWEPAATSFERLVSPDTTDTDRSRPYPFFLAYALEGAVAELGDVHDWQAEWKWDGIRAQLVRRGGETWIWTRGEELATERFPELGEAAALLPDGTVLDGEVMPWRDDRPLPFAQLQRRIGRTKLGPKILREVPVVLIVYDLLEYDGTDLRPLPLQTRRERLVALLEAIPDTGRFLLSPVLDETSWDALSAQQARAREELAEGLMLKRRDAPYGVGRRKGPWWKWKVDPFTADAVLIYAQPGSGRRASLHTDYTFGVWNDDGELVPFAKAYSGLTDAEIRKLDAWIRRNTMEKFGPVRHVKPEHVFELAFEGIQRSTRHKSGVAVRFPRMVRWRSDKVAREADTLGGLLALIGEQERIRDER